MLFGFVAAGEVHPQPHILMFGKNKVNLIITGKAY
jgi:hypothetical protein